MTAEHSGKTQGNDAPAKYEEFFVPAIGAPLASDLIDLAGLQPGERVLDAACGTGIVARFAAEKVGSTGAVVGVDINPGMLAVARIAAPPKASITWHQASIENLPLPSDSFDAAICQLSLQFVEDRTAALREMHRVLKANGRVCLNVPGPASPVFGAIAEALGNHASPQAAGFVRQVFVLHDTDEVRDLMAEAGFRDIEVGATTKTLRLPNSRDFLWQYVESTPLAAVATNLNEAARRKLEREVVERCQDMETDGALICRQRIVVAQARN